MIQIMARVVSEEKVKSSPEFKTDLGTLGLSN